MKYAIVGMAGMVAVAFVGLAFRQARKRGEMEAAKESAENEARIAEAVAQAASNPDDLSDTVDNLSDGTF